MSKSDEGEYCLYCWYPVFSIYVIILVTVISIVVIINYCMHNCNDSSSDNKYYDQRYDISIIAIMRIITMIM